MICEWNYTYKSYGLTNEQFSLWLAVQDSGGLSIDKYQCVS